MPRAVCSRITGNPRAGDVVFESLILAAGVEYELRRTCYPHLPSTTDLAQLGDEPQTLGTDCLALREYCVAGCASALPGI